MPCFAVNLKGNLAVLCHHSKTNRSVVSIDIYKRMLQIHKLSLLFAKRFTEKFRKSLFRTAVAGTFRFLHCHLIHYLRYLIVSL